MLALGPVVSIAIIYALVGSDIDAVRDELAQARYVYLLPTGALLILSLLTRAVRWHILLDHKITIWHSFHITNTGYFLSGVLPLRLGDLARAWMVKRLDVPVAGFTAISSIVVERLLDLLALVAMLGVMLVLLDVPPEVASAGVFIAVMALAGGVVLAALSARPQWAFRMLRWAIQRLPFLKRLDAERRFENFIEGIQPMSKPRVAFGALMWTGISWLCSLAAGYVLLFFLFDEPTVAATVSLIVLASLSVALPAVPGNLGPFEGAVVGGLWIGGMVTAASPPENAPAVATGVVLHALTLGIYVTLGMIGLSVEQASLRQVTSGAQEFVHEQPTRPIISESLT